MDPHRDGILSHRAWTETETYLAIVSKMNQQRDGSIREPSNFSRAGSVEAQILEAKLRELKAEEARRLKDLDLEPLDEDIMAVERTLKLVKPAVA
jgi:hypothetical protein